MYTLTSLASGGCGSARTMTLEPVYNAEQAVRTLTKKRSVGDFYFIPSAILHFAFRKLVYTSWVRVSRRKNEKRGIAGGRLVDYSCFGCGDCK